MVLAWGAQGPGPDRLCFGLGGQGSWAGPAWVWLGRPRVLGRAGLVLNTLKNHDSDGDVNLNTFLGHAIRQGKNLFIIKLFNMALALFHKHL